VLKDSTVISLAKIRPCSKEELLRVKDLQGSTARKQGARLLELVEQTNQLPADQLPHALPDPIQSADKPTLARIQAVVKTCAEQQALVPELLMSRKQMGEATLRLLSGQQDLLPPGISQWRRQLLEVKLQELAGQ
jgi:ribonuclease D